MNGNINMDSTIAGSMNGNINTGQYNSWVNTVTSQWVMDSTIAGSMNGNINMDSTIAGSMGQ